MTSVLCNMLICMTLVSSQASNLNTRDSSTTLQYELNSTQTNIINAEIYEWGAYENVNDQNDWKLYPTSDSDRWLLGLRMNKTVWGFQPNIESNTTITIVGTSRKYHGVIISLSMYDDISTYYTNYSANTSNNSLYWSLSQWHNDKQMINTYMYPSCGVETSRPNYAEGNIYYAMKSSTTYFKTAAGGSNTDWDEVDEVDMLDMSISLQYQLNGNLRMGIGGETICYYKDIPTAQYMDLYITASNPDGDLTISQFILTKEVFTLSPTASAPTTSHPTSLPAIEITMQPTYAPSAHLSVIPTAMSSTLQPDSLPTIEPTMLASFRPSLSTTLYPINKHSLLNSTDVEGITSVNNDKVNLNSSILLFIVIAGGAVCLLLTLIFCACVMCRYKSNINLSDHPSRFEMVIKMSNPNRNRPISVQIPKEDKLPSGNMAMPQVVNSQSNIDTGTPGSPASQHEMNGVKERLMSFSGSAYEEANVNGSARDFDVDIGSFNTPGSLVDKDVHDTDVEDLNFENVEEHKDGYVQTQVDEDEDDDDVVVKEMGTLKETEHGDNDEIALPETTTTGNEDLNIDPPAAIEKTNTNAQDEGHY